MEGVVFNLRLSIHCYNRAENYIRRDISSMGPGKAFELFVKRILVNIGFSEVVSDGLYIYDGTPG